jgi:hypothetical protein
MSAPLLSQPKRLHRMNRLEDVGPLPGGGLHGSNDQCDGRNLVHLLALQPCGRQVFRWFSRNQGIGWRGGWKADRAVSKCSFVPLERQTTIKTQPKISYVD